MTTPIYNITRHIKACGDNAPLLQQVLDDHSLTFQSAKGSTHNHQAWPGGYLQHIADCLTIAQHIFAIDWYCPFPWSSVVLVQFLHDIEKPFMQQRMANDNHMPLWTKTQRKQFRNELIAHYKIQLTPEEICALDYIEGEGDHYKTDSRTMNELGALCHAADVLSSRLWHSREKPENS